MNNCTMENFDAEEKDFEPEETSPASRLNEPVSLDRLLSGETSQFSIRTDDDDNCLGELDIDVTKVFDYDALEKVCLTENLECSDSDDEDGTFNSNQPFFHIRRKMIGITDDGKIMKKIETQGYGPLPADDNLIVYVHYDGYLEFAEYPFDSTRLRCKKPCKLRLGDGTILEGLEIAIRSMQIGEKSKFIIHPDYAFKDLGIPPRVPPHAFLLFHVELIRFCANVENEQPTDEELSFDEVLKRSKQCRNCAKVKKEMEKDARGAINLYKKGLKLMLTVHYKSDEEENLRKEELIKLYTNLAICYIQTNQPKQTCNMYNEAVKEGGKLIENNVKFLYTSAKALRMLSSFDEAKKRLKRASRLKPGDEFICAEIERVDEAIEKARAVERSMSKRMFGFTPVNDSIRESKELEQLSQQVGNDFISKLKEIIDEFLVQNEESTKLDFSYTAAEKSFIIDYCKKRKLVLKILDSGVIIIRKPAF